MEGRPKESYKIKEEEAIAFLDTLPRRAGAIDLSQLEKIGSGGSHDVFSYGTGNYVLKIHRSTLTVFEDVRDVTPDIVRRTWGRVDDKRKMNEKVYEEFGVENCLVEEYVLDSVVNEGKTQNTLVTIQEKSEAFKAKEKADFSSEYIDKEHATHPIADEDYEALLAPLTKDDFDRSVFIKNQSSFEKIFKLIDEDESFRKVITQFVEGFRRFYSKTGVVLDFVGNENALFYKDNEGKWRFQLGSVVKNHGAKDEFEEALRMINEDPSRKLEGVYVSSYVNTIANAIGINATALQLGLPRVFDIKLNQNHLDVIKGRTAN